MHCNILCHIVALFRLWSTKSFFYCVADIGATGQVAQRVKTLRTVRVKRRRVVRLHGNVLSLETWKAFRKFCAWSRASNFRRPPYKYMYILYVDDLYCQCCSSDIYNINCDKCLLTRSIWCRKVVVVVVVASNYSNYEKKPWRINQAANCHVL